MDVFIVITELATPTGIPTKEEKIEIETNPETVQAKISKCSILSYKSFCVSYLLIHFAYFLR